MNEKINKKIIILPVLAIIFSVIGATFAYFSATVTGNNNVNVLSYKFDVTLAVNRVNPASEPSKGYGMIPLDETDIATAINAGCVDSNGYAACTIYELTFTNNSGVAITLNGELNVTSNNFASLKYSVTAIGGAKSTLSTGTALGSSAVTTGFTNLTIPTGTSTMYLMLYIENQSSNQTTDQGKTFSGTLTFTDVSGGSELYAQFGPSSESGNMSVLNVGDYISYTPSLSTATALGTMTGCDASGYGTDINGTGITYTPSDRSFAPNELTLWRVYRKIPGVGVEIIPEYVSTQTIYFKSEKGYKNLVGYLNELASKYENSDYTVSGYSRHFGSDWNTGYCKTHNNWSTCGQTQYIGKDNVTGNDNGNQLCGGSACTSSSVAEPLGGGDEKYLQDYSYIRGETYNGVSGTTAFGGSSQAYKKNGAATPYWMASRYYNFSSDTYYYFYGRCVYSYGSRSSGYLYYYSSIRFNIGYDLYALRPIVTLDSSLEYDGVGSKDSPLTITNTKS